MNVRGQAILRAIKTYGIARNLLLFCYLGKVEFLLNQLIACRFLCYHKKVCLRKHEKFVLPFFFTEFCFGSDDKIQVIIPAPYIEQNHCLEVRGEGCNS